VIGSIGAAWARLAQGFGLYGLAAVWWPARTAASMDPAWALKSD